jgi:hypothetical protein
MKQNIKINNKRILISGVVSSALFSLIICGLLQGGAAHFAGASGIEFGLSGIKLYARFAFGGSVAAAVFLNLIPFLLMLLVVTITAIGLKWTPPGSKRLFYIAFSLVQSGFLIFNLFYGIFSVVLKANLDNDWVKIVTLLGYSETGSIIFCFLVIIFTAGYLNLVLKRILKYINI